MRRITKGYTLVLAAFLLVYYAGVFSVANGPEPVTIETIAPVMNPSTSAPSSLPEEPQIASADGQQSPAINNDTTTKPPTPVAINNDTTAKTETTAVNNDTALKPKVAVSTPADKPNSVQKPSRQAPLESPSSPARVVPNSQSDEMLKLINAERVKNNVAPLVLSNQLSIGALLKSKDMAENNYFSHTSPTYGSPFDMMKSLGISYKMAAENIARNRSVQAAHDAFMNSPGHRENVLNPELHEVGLGFFQNGDDLYVTQWFTN